MHLKPASMIKADLGIQEGGPVHAFFTDTCKNYMEKYIPYSGDDMNSVHLRENIDQGVDYITYQSEYAHAQYVGYTTGPVVNYTTPGTGPYWDKVMWSAEGQDVIKKVQEYMENGNR